MGQILFEQYHERTHFGAGFGVVQPMAASIRARGSSPMGTKYARLCVVRVQSRQGIRVLIFDAICRTFVVRVSITDRAVF